MGIWYYHSIVPVADAWDYVPTAGQLEAVVEALRAHAWIREDAAVDATVTDAQGKRRRLLGRSLWPKLAKVGDLREHRVQVVADQAVVPSDYSDPEESVFPRNVLQPGILERVVLSITPLLTVFPYDFDGERPGVPCLTCGHDLAQPTSAYERRRAGLPEAFWPPAWASDEVRGLPRGCPQCGARTDPGSLRGDFPATDGSPARSPFYRFRIHTDTGKRRPLDTVADLDPALRSALRDAAGVDVRSTCTYA